MLRVAFWTVALAGALIIVVVAANRVRFGRRVAVEVRRLWGSEAPTAALPDPDRIAALPPVLRSYAERVARGGPFPRAVRLRHHGRFRTKLDGPWLEVVGRQYFATAPPGFVWWGRVRMAPGLWFDVRDLCIRGEGQMYAALESTLAVADAKGPVIDRGALTRVLGEMAWFPASYFDPRYVTWTAAAERAAQATLRIEGREVAARFSFDDDGLPRSIQADRDFDLGRGQSALRPWLVELADYRQVRGLPVPFSAVVSWQVGERILPYADFQVDSVEYDAREPFD